MRNLYNSRYLMAFSVVFLLWCCEGNAQAQAPEITVEEYCRLTVSLMELSVKDWQGRLAVANQSKNKSDRKKLQAELEKAAKGRREEEEDLFGKFSLSQREYLRYAGKHKAEIESYLEENPDVQNMIESAKKRIDGLIQEFESTVPKRQEGDRE